MVKRTTEQWLALFEAHARSGLSQAQFCKEQGLCPKYFSLRRRQLTPSSAQSKFVRVRRTRPVCASHADRPASMAATPVEWQLQIGEIRCLIRGAPVEQVLHVLKGLM